LETGKMVSFCFRPFNEKLLLLYLIIVRQLL